MSSNEEAAPTPAADRSPNLANLAYRSAADMIRSRRLRGGDVIVEAKLAATLGVSRTPMREALQRLEGEGLVPRLLMAQTTEAGETLPEADPDADAASRLAARRSTPRCWRRSADSGSRSLDDLPAPNDGKLHAA